MRKRLQKNVQLLTSLLSGALLGGSVIFGCAHYQTVATQATTAHRGLASKAPNRCLAVRGNGELVMAHFSSLAAITEHFGLFDSLAGGSSATLSMLIYESIAQSPAIYHCAGGAECTPEQTALRAALLLKSVYAYVDVVENSPTGQEALNLYSTILKLQKGLKNIHIEKLQAKGIVFDLEDVHEIQDEFHKLIKAQGTRSLMNTRSVHIMVDGKGDTALGLSPLTDSQADLAIRAQRLRTFYNEIKSFGDFKADSPAIFFRPGLASFDGLAQDIGMIANFFAGRGNLADSSDYDEKGLEAFVNSCAEPSRGLSWSELASANPGCKNQVIQLIQNYDKNHNAHSVLHPRVRDQVGQYLHILAGSGIIPGAAEQYKTVARRFLNATGSGYAFQPGDFDVFNLVKFAYFGSPEDIDLLTRNAKTSAYSSDYKMERVDGIKSTTWEEVINYSPAEPGLSSLNLPAQLYDLPESPWQSRALSLVASPSDVFTGGWSDLTPTLALRNIGCSQILYITRREPESTFAQGLIMQMGATVEQKANLYSLDPSQAPPSSFEVSLKAADGVWCTDWNAADLEIPHVSELDHDAYAETHLETSSPQTVLSMLVDSRDPFSYRIVPHNYEGCGGHTAVLPGHHHAANP